MVSGTGIRTQTFKSWRTAWEALWGLLAFELVMEDRLGSPLGIAGFWTLGMEDRLGSPLGIAGFYPFFFLLSKILFSTGHGGPPGKPFGNCWLRKRAGSSFFRHGED